MGDTLFNTEIFEIEAYHVPSITVYNRLEASPRTADFDRSLKAEVRDPLWMLTRQWQFGEFKGEDAATAVSTKILGEHTTINTIHFPGNKKIEYNGKAPLEAIVERETFTEDLATALQMSRYFIKLIKAKPGFAESLNQLITVFPFDFDIDPNDYHALELLNTASGKTFNGIALNKAISNGTIQPEIAAVYSVEIEDFKRWISRNYYSSADSAWLPSSLEYQFAVSASAGETIGKEFTAQHYPGGHLDWYSFDIGTSSSLQEAGQGVEKVQTYIPTPVTFKGMPLPRFWMMEDNYTDLGRIDTSPTGLLHLLLAEFSLTCSNDWFMLPYLLPINTACEVKGILVKDVFGEYTIIRPAGAGSQSDWQRWTMFEHSRAFSSESRNTNLFYLVPAVGKSLESPRLEQVNFLRDEMANLVWAVENIVPSQAGIGVDGNHMALEKDLAPVVGTPVADNNAAVTYILGTTLPHNWIPFIPVPLNQNTSETRLQRAKLPNSKGAVGRLLSENKAPYFIDEKLLDSTGLLVSRSAQVSRFINGTTYSWVGRRKEAGKVDWSNLKFDQIEGVK